MAQAISKVPGRFQDWIQADLVAAVQYDAVPRDVAFDAEKCMELRHSEKLQYFEQQKTQTFAEFWERRENSKDRSGAEAQDKETSKNKKNKGE